MCDNVEPLTLLLWLLKVGGDNWMIMMVMIMMMIIMAVMITMVNDHGANAPEIETTVCATIQTSLALQRRLALTSDTRYLGLIPWPCAA